MKRRFPGETDGPTGGRHFDVRGGRTPNQQGRGWPPMMGRGPPGRFMGPSSAPPIHHPGGRGMPPMFGGGPQGRGLPAPFHGRGPPVRGMARPMDTRGGMRGPHDSFGGRGPPQGRISPGRGIPPPPPPRLNPGQVGGAFPSRPPPHHNTMPPPPMLPGSFSHHHQPTAMLKHVPPPPLRYQHPTQALLPLGTPFRPPAPYAPIAPATTTTAPLAVAHVPTYSGATAISALQPSAVPPPTKPRVPTQLELDAAWSEHTDDKGVIFFHNPFLNESTYTRPTALKKSDGSDSMPVKKQWLEYTDPSSGKKYYSDGSTTTWEKPAELSSSSVTNTDESLTVNEQPKRKKKKAELEDYANKAEAIAGFKGFLLVKGIPPSSKWNDVAKLLSTNPRWEAFAESLSIGERRQALAEYQTKRANDLKNQERQERIRAKEAYGQLLTDVLQSLNGFSTTNPRFSDVRAALAKDDRFHGVADEAARESLFLDFCEELRKREQRQKRSKKREIVDAFNSFLREKEEAGILTFASTWDLFLSRLTAADKEDSRFQITPLLTESERQIYFADFVILLQAEEDDKRRRIQDARYRAEKAQREAYQDVLKRLSIEGRIRPYTQWRAIVDFVKVEESFDAVLGQDQDAPMEIFEEFVGEWDVAYRRERALLSKLIDESCSAEPFVKHDTPFEDFTQNLLSRAERPSDLYSDVKRIINREDPVSTARIYWEELVSKAHHAAQRQGNQVDHEESSEDEGEIIEGEVDDEKGRPPQRLQVTDVKEDVHRSSESSDV